MDIERCGEWIAEESCVGENIAALTGSATDDNRSKHKAKLQLDNFSLLDTFLPQVISSKVLVHNSIAGIRLPNLW